jgi:hypothetical protein
MFRLSPAVRRRATLVAGLAVAAGVAAAARPLALIEGATFQYRVSSSRQDQKGAPSASYLSTVRMAGGNVRMDYVQGTNPLAGKDGYMVIRGDDERLAMVNVKERQVMVLDAAALGSGMGAMLNNPMLKLSFKDQSFSYEDLGAGETILGSRTRKYRMRQKYTMEMRVMGIRRSNTEESVTDHWIASDVKGIDERAMRRWSKAFGSGVKITNPELAQQMERFLKESRGGMALKSVIVATHGDGKKTETDTTTMEVVELKPATHEASIFTWPADYTVTDMGQVLAGVGDSLRAASARAGDSTGAAPAASTDSSLKRGAKEAVKGEAIKAGLRGVLGRKKPV